MKYAIIEELRLQSSVKELCRQLDLSESSYCSWRTRLSSRRQRDDDQLKIVIKAAHKRTRETSGPKRLQQDIVKHEGVQVGVHRIKRLRRELGIQCRQKRKFKETTNSNHSLPVAKNLVGQDFIVTVPNRVWLTDITSIRTERRLVIFFSPQGSLQGCSKEKSTYTCRSDYLSFFGYLLL